MAFNVGGLLEAIISIAPTVVQAVESLASKKKMNSGLKAETALAMAQAGIVSALGADPSAFGQPEKQLVVSVNNAMVAYFNAKGWPTADLQTPAVQNAAGPVISVGPPIS